MNSLQSIIEEQKPTFIGISETRLNKGDPLEIEGYEVKRRDRTGDGGGVLIAYKREIENIVRVVREEHGKFEMIWVKLDNTVTKVRIGVVYMPQENETTVDELQDIYRMIEEEIETAITQGEKIMLMGDFNCKVGAVIPNNNEKITKGGRILLKMIEKYNLSLLNSESCCTGTWTRIEGDEKSILDYMIVQKDELESCKEMSVDENKDYTPYHMEMTERGQRIVYTDHCMMKCDVDWYVKLEKTATRKVLIQEEKLNLQLN